MKIDRIIGIIFTLLQQDKVSVNDLANKFEVSYRTVLRDIDVISLAGIPIFSERGRNGGVRIMDGFKPERTLLSREDMQAVLSGLQGLDSISGNNRYRQLMDKLSAQHSDIMNADNHIIIDLSSWDKSAVSDKIELIKGAIERCMKISFTYYAPNGESNRIIEPYHLVFQWSSWYVWGYCTLRNDYRMFKLTRLADLKCMNEKCEERSVPEYMCDKLRHTKGEIEAVVKFDSSVKWRIIDEFGTELTETDNEGNILLQFTWSDIPSFYQYILTFGDKAEIISPKEYRTEFTRLLNETLNKYVSQSAQPKSFSESE